VIEPPAAAISVGIGPPGDQRDELGDHPPRWGRIEHDRLDVQKSTPVSRHPNGCGTQGGRLMRTATIVVVFASLSVILVLIGIMLVHWRRFRAETDRYRAWQAVFGQRGAKVALTAGFVALAVLVGTLLAFQARPLP
jgi:hypothetical protein